MSSQRWGSDISPRNTAGYFVLPELREGISEGTKLLCLLGSLAPGLF